MLKQRILNCDLYFSLCLLAIWWLPAATATRAWAQSEPAAQPIEIAYMWQHHPQLDFLWLEEESLPIVRPSAAQLLSPRASERLTAAQWIARVPNSPGFKQPEILLGVLQRLKQGEPEAVIRASLISAACQLDDGAHAAELWSIAKGDLLAEPIIETACIKWQQAAPLAVWRERIRSRAGTLQERLRAVDGLAVVGDETDLPTLTEQLFDLTIADTLRLALARAVGRLSQRDQMTLVKKIKASATGRSDDKRGKSSKRPAEGSSGEDIASEVHYGLDDLLSVYLLYNATDAEAAQFVDGVLSQGTPLAQRTAYEWSCRNNLPAARKLAAVLSKSPDAEIRRLAILRIEEANDAETLPVLFDRLADPHPQNRRLAREQLLISANRTAERRLEVCQALEKNFGGEDWRSLEQCCRLAVELRQAQLVNRLVKLLAHERAEVSIAAAWALRNLATEQSTFAAMLNHAEMWAKRFVPDVQGPVPLESDYRRIAHLLEAFGQKRYAPAEQLLLKFVPKVGGTGLICRMCGTWACGKMWEHKKNPGLVTELHARIADKNNLFAEPVSLRYCATLALGWIADPESREPLVDNNEGIPSPIHYATEWALGRLKD